MSQEKTLKTIKEQLDDREKVALTFLETSLMTDKYHWFLYIRSYEQHEFNGLISYLDTNNLLVKALNYIIGVLYARDVVEEALRNYSGSDKDILIHKFNDAEKRYAENLRGVYVSYVAFDFLSDDLLMETSDSSSFLVIIKLIVDYIMTNLNNEEKAALTFLTNSVTDPNPDDPEDGRHVMYSRKTFYEIIAYISIDRLKKILAYIVITLNAKSVAEKAVESYDGPGRDILVQRLEKIKIIYVKYLKTVFNFGSSFDQICYNLSIETNNSSRFEDIIYYVKYYRIVNQLSNAERDALAFLKDFITASNPSDTDDCKLVIHTKQTFYRFILGIDDIEKIKTGLSGIVATLNAKKVVELLLMKYNGLRKVLFTQEIKEAETTYIMYLKNVYSTFFVEKMNNNLLSKANYAYQFAIIEEKIKSYNDTYSKIVEQLDDDEKGALTFLEDAIATPNPDNPNDREIIIRSRQTFYFFYKFVLHSDKINRFRMAVSGIVATLQAKKIAEEALANYNGPEKNILVQKLKNAEITYVKYLKNICNTSSVDEMENNLFLLRKRTYTPQFKMIEDKVKSYNDTYSKIVEQLDDDEKGALTFLEDAIATPNPGNPDDREIIIRSRQTFYFFYKFVLHSDKINRFRMALSGIVATLQAKKIAEEALANYNGLEKNVLIQKLKNAEITYVKYLKSICDTSSVDEMENNLLKETIYASQFKGITDEIYSYNISYDQIAEQLSDKERDALIFLRNSVEASNPDYPDDHEIIIETKKNYNLFILNAKDDVNKLKIALSCIVTVLQVNKTAAEVIEKHTESEKKMIEQILGDEKLRYRKFLKSIFNTNFFDDIYINLT
ncbi:BTA121 domain-containing protein surface lipoprotein [Borrelia persica]|uniref:BTA121 domain-containing protein surface lipoprotein n=1 Tax=Borrelia persica TaxID=44448 RepID=UPI0004644CBB|nr:hypothetical protein [Borrelia persica]